MLTGNMVTVIPEIAAIKGVEAGVMPGIKQSHVLFEDEGQAKIVEAISFARLDEHKVRLPNGTPLLAGKPTDNWQFKKIAWATSEMGPTVNEKGYFTFGWVTFDPASHKFYITGRPPKHGVVARFNTGTWGSLERAAEYVARMEMDGSGRRLHEVHGVETQRRLNLNDEDLNLLLANEFSDAEQKEHKSGRYVTHLDSGAYRRVPVPSRMNEGKVPTLSIRQRTTSLWTFRDDEEVFVSGCFPGAMFRAINKQGRLLMEPLKGAKWREAFLEAAYDRQVAIIAAKESRRAAALTVPPTETQLVA